MLQDRVPLRVLREYSDATVTGTTPHPVAAEYPHSTLNSTPTFSSYISIVLYETHVAGKEEIWMCSCMLYLLLPGLLVRKLCNITPQGDCRPWNYTKVFSETFRSREK